MGELLKGLIKSIPSIGGGIMSLPVVGGGLSLLVGLAKGVWDMITKDTAKEMAELEPISIKSSAEDIQNLTEVFENCKEQVHREAQKMENAVCEEVEYYLEEVNNLLSENKTLMDHYHIRARSVDRRMREILSGVSREFELEISRSMCLSNPECKRVLEMVQGTRREQAMAEFLENMIKRVLDQCIRNIREILNEIFEEVQDETLGAVEQVERETESFARELDTMQEDNYIEKTEELTERAAGTIAGCDIIEMWMEV